MFGNNLFSEDLDIVPSGLTVRKTDTVFSVFYIEAFPHIARVDVIKNQHLTVVYFLQCIPVDHLIFTIEVFKNLPAIDRLKLFQIIIP